MLRSLQGQGVQVVGWVRGEAPRSVTLRVGDRAGLRSSPIRRGSTSSSCRVARKPGVSRRLFPVGLTTLSCAC